MDLRKLKTLLSLMERHGLLEMEIEEEGERIRLKKGMEGAPPQALPTAGPAAPPSAPSEIPLRKSELLEVKSPIVGTFYRSPKPGDPPFVETGQRVAKGTTLCVVEAMKVMNEIKSEFDGVVEEILVENGIPVEYGQVLIRISP